MDFEKVIELQEKRRLLQEEVRLRTLRTRIAKQLNYLEKENYSYNLFYNHENLNWIRLNIPVKKRDNYDGMYDDFQINVADLPLEFCDVYAEQDLFTSSKFSAQFLSIISPGTTLIVCCEGGDPEIALSGEAFLTNPIIFFSNPETWIITKEKNWVIEYIWDHKAILFIELNQEKPNISKKIIIQ